MFESLRLDHTLIGYEWSHVDVELKWLRGKKLHPDVRFKFFRKNSIVGLEFRNGDGWPRMFDPWPGKQADKYGSFFMVSSDDIAGDALAGLDREGATLLRDIASDLLPAIRALVQETDQSVQVWPRIISDASDFHDYIIGQLDTNVGARSVGYRDSLASAAALVERNEKTSPLEQGPMAAKPDTVATASPSDIPDYVRSVIDEYERVTLTPINQSRRPLPEFLSPIIISVVKDEFDRLHDFLRHYRTAGTERFVFIDNGSSDGTLEYLCSQADVDVYARNGKFDWRLKQGWINKIISMYGFERWYGYFDADEHVVFDGLGARTLGDMVRIVQRNGITRIRGFMLDMYANGELLQSRYETHARLDKAYPYFDSSSYNEEIYKEVISVKGGPRTRAFGKADKQFRPEMTKYPLFRLREGEFMANPHHIWPYTDNFSSERYLAILHYKFLPNVVGKIKRAILEENYWGGSLEYKCYMAVLEKEPKLSLMCGMSQRYFEPQDLVKIGLIAQVPWASPPKAFERLRSAYLCRLAAQEAQSGLSKLEMMLNRTSGATHRD